MTLRVEHQRKSPAIRSKTASPCLYLNISPPERTLSSSYYEYFVQVTIVLREPQTTVRHRFSTRLVCLADGILIILHGGNPSDDLPDPCPVRASPAARPWETRTTASCEEFCVMLPLTCPLPPPVCLPCVQPSRNGRQSAPNPRQHPAVLLQSPECLGHPRFKQQEYPSDSRIPREGYE